MKKNKIFLILVSCLALTSCQSVKDGLTGNKGENNDEFLVKKKNPLILPPENKAESLNQDDLDIQKMLGIEESQNLPSTQSGDAEEFVLRNIKDN